MPFFGRVLADLTEPPISALTGGVSHVEEALIRDLARVLGIQEAHSCAEIAEDLVRSELGSSQWVHGVLRFVESDIPGMGALLLRFARQVNAYLSLPDVQATVDAIVRPSLLDGPTVVVSHSLGSIIAYRLLRKADRGADVPLFVTLGSPLGIQVIKTHLNPPELAVPPAVGRWLNATDARDCVELHARLDGDTFVDGIENVDDVRHVGGSPLAIDVYLGHAVVASHIHAALARGATA